MPELKKQESGETKRFEVALKSKLIRDASFEEVKEKLKFVMVKVGLRANNWPNEIETVVLFEHIKDNFGGNNIDEIRLAFDMAIGGKLEMNKDESVVPFENFSCLYFSSIMNAYRKWSAQEYRHLKIADPPPQKIFTQEEIDDGFRKDVEVQYGYFLKGFKLKGTEFNIPILLKDGLISEGEKLEDFFTRMVNKGQSNIYVQGSD